MTRKPLIFTRHAEDAIVERELDREWIERTVHDPEWVVPDTTTIGAERRYRTIPEFGGRALRVVCLETAGATRILTVFFDRKAKRP